MRQAVVDDFNRDFPVGSPVVLEMDSGPIVTAVKGAAYLVGGNTPVAFFEGVRGSYSCERWRVRRVGD